MSIQSTLEIPGIAEAQRVWLQQLNGLIQTVQGWATEMGWSTRRIEKSMKDSEVGRYVAPALIMQEETARIMLEPIARSVPDAEGIVDLYLMPAYDDIARLYLSDGEWLLNFAWSGTPHGDSNLDTESKPLTKEILQQVLQEMKSNAAHD